MKMVSLRNIGTALTLAILASSVLAYGQSAEARHRIGQQQDEAFYASQNGPFPERVLPDGTVTGPIDRSANGG